MQPASDLTLQELALEPAIYLIPECDTPQEIADELHGLCEEIFVWRAGSTQRLGVQTLLFRSGWRTLRVAS